MNNSVSQLEEANRFKKHLEEYWASKGMTQNKIPQIGGKELNLFKLYKSVCKKGGGQAVSHNKMWKEIVDQFGLPSTCTSASFTLKNHYQKYLLGYEQRFYFGKEDNVDLPELVAGRTRKPMIGMRGNEDGQINGGYFNRYSQRPMDSSSLGAQLSKYYQKCDVGQTVNYIKRTKMYPSMPEVKRMILGFQSRLKQQINFSINTLMLYSVNTQAPFLFMQYPNVIQSITGFIKWLYPPKNIEGLETLRCLLVSLRNLAIDYRNLQPIQESGLADFLKHILDQKIDRQVSRNIIDILSSLANIELDYGKTAHHVQQYLQRDSLQDLETGIDLLKTLVEQQQKNCEDIIVNKIDFFARLLMHQQSFVRQAILQIFAYVTEKSQIVRSACLNNFRFMDRIFALLSYSIGNSQQQLQLAGYILSNLQKSKQNLEALKKFEKKLAIISFNDDSLSSITTSLLCRLTQPEQCRMQDEKEKQQENN